MDPVEMARELGKTIQQDDRYIRYDLAKAKNDLDEELQAFIGEFNLKRINLNNESKRSEKDEDKISKLNDAINDLYEKIMGNESMKEYTEAKSQVDEMMEQITTILELTVRGENPDTAGLTGGGCSGSCAGCSGCN